ncbi:ABC transporter B family member chloroplastic-like, partial [Trifolium pratense]
VKRLRENLYATILFQDISYFDKDKVGTLTSRLAADCQRLSHVIGNDLQLILRNTFQGTGAIINLLALSWPLALSALMICAVLSAIFLILEGKQSRKVHGFYDFDPDFDNHDGQNTNDEYVFTKKMSLVMINAHRYQRKAARLTQDFTACANDVAQETLSLIRIVRVYGTGKEEFERYNQWLQKLAFISVRESVGNGFWNLSFNTLYRSTQIVAVIFGGMSVLSCRVTAEQLTKYVLYCEWLIYAAWRVTNSLSSLLQSIGASEQIFQLMNLLPCDQFLVKGK